MSILWCCPTHVMYFKTFFYNGKKKISINFEFLVCVDLAVDWEKGELVVNFHRLKQLITNKMNLTHLYFVHQWDHKYTLKAWKTLIPSLLFLLFELLSWLISEKKCLIILFNTNYIVFQQLQCYGYHYLKTILIYYLKSFVVFINLPVFPFCHREKSVNTGIWIQTEPL